MSRGPGKYDQECGAAREATAAEAVLLIVINGKLGSGFSVQANEGSPTLAALPGILRDVAAQIAQDVGQ